MWGDNRIVGTIPTSPSRGLQVRKAGGSREGMHKMFPLVRKSQEHVGRAENCWLRQ